ncbi:MAG TPA: hypothetical protein VJU59_07695 [Paraburkholderia sp.]|uniref:hypothetical protein n=1 Tax=Paraburkholderia sp. TaxID=1926495 RepID=UPI002B49B93E|nr:hypothetical protein [Paraburkholderia sp.]HKR39548.1 hypothetical protein [Paraburkholderia sp.]
MKTRQRAAVVGAILFALSGATLAQGGGNAGSGAGSGNGGAGGQGSTGMSTPNAGAATGATSTSKGANTMKAPPGTSKNYKPEAKGASDTAASSAQ